MKRKKIIELKIRLANHSFDENSYSFIMECGKMHKVCMLSKDEPLNMNEMRDYFMQLVDEFISKCNEIDKVSHYVLNIQQQ